MSRKQDSLTKSFSGEFNTCTVEKSRYFYAFLMAGKSFTPTILIKVNEQHNYHSREIVHTQHLTGKFLYICTLFLWSTMQNTNVQCTSPVLYKY